MFKIVDKNNLFFKELYLYIVIVIIVFKIFIFWKIFWNGG